EPYPPIDMHYSGDSLKLAHIGLAIGGESFAVVACMGSLIYLIQQRALKQKNFGQMLPSAPGLFKLDGMLNLTLWWGFLLITAALVTGAVYYQWFEPREHWQQVRIMTKVIWALAVWGWYLVTLISRNVLQKPARLIAIMALVGF